MPNGDSYGFQLKAIIQGHPWSNVAQGVAALEWQSAQDTPERVLSQNELHKSEAFYRKKSPFWPCGDVISEFETRT